MMETKLTYHALERSKEGHVIVDRLITGDFNDRCVTWNDSHSSSELGMKLHDLVTDNGLTQIIASPTHLDNTGRPQHLLDLIMTDSPELIIDSHILAPIDKCQHCPALCKLAISLL